MDQRPPLPRYAFGRTVTPDVVLDALRAELYELLTPERYDCEAVLALQSKIVRHLESRNRIDRVNDAALAVAGYQDAHMKWAA